MTATRILRFANLFGKSWFRKHPRRRRFAKRFTPLLGIECLEDRLMLAGILGTAESFAVLGGSAVTNTGPTTLNGDLGVFPGTSITGRSDITLSGDLHQTDAVAMQAQNDVTIAYNDLAGRASNFDLTGQDLGGLTLVPGVYTFSSSAQLTGTLTLNALGNPNAEFIFQIGELDHNGQQLFGCADQWCRCLQRVLAGRELRDARDGHRIRRAYSRTHEHHLEYECNHCVRERLSSKWRSDTGQQRDLQRRLSTGQHRLGEAGCEQGAAGRRSLRSAPTR